MGKRNALSLIGPQFPEELLDGLRNYWYPMLPSDELTDDKPVAIRRLGEDLVLWRGPSEKVRLFADYCPHKGAPLSLGRINAQGRLECRYHGLQYDEEGQCRSIPYERQEDGPETSHYRVQTYPSEERAGFIWGYIGDVEAFPPPPLKLEPEIEGPDYHALLMVEPTWNTSWPVMMDNITDPFHVAFLHRETAARFAPPETDLLEHFVPTGVRSEVIDGDLRLQGSLGVQLRQAAERQGAGEEVTAFYLPCTIKIDIPLPIGGEMRIVLHITPVDDAHSMFYQHTCRKVKSDEERREWEEIYPRLDPMMRAVQSEDRWITEAQGSVAKARANERPLPVDEHGIEARKLVLRAWQSQQEVYKERKKAKAL